VSPVKNRFFFVHCTLFKISTFSAVTDVSEGAEDAKIVTLCLYIISCDSIAYFLNNALVSEDAQRAD
jgi:hypothetical protein